MPSCPQGLRGGWRWGEEDRGSDLFCTRGISASTVNRLVRRVVRVISAQGSAAGDLAQIDRF